MALNQWTRISDGTDDEKKFTQLLVLFIISWSIE